MIGKTDRCIVRAFETAACCVMPIIYENHQGTANPMLSPYLVAHSDHVSGHQESKSELALIRRCELCDGVLVQLATSLQKGLCKLDTVPSRNALLVLFIQSPCRAV